MHLQAQQKPVRIVITGGPSAGKTTLLEFLGNVFGNQVSLAPEAATIYYLQGFPRPVTVQDRIQTQRSIYKLQQDLESIASKTAGVPVFCDRGSIDGSAYWMGSLEEFCFSMGTTVHHELSRYTAVLHLQSAAVGSGYVQSAIRTESPAEAVELDRKIGEHWGLHPRYMFVPNTGTFEEKLNMAVELLTPYLPVQSKLTYTSRYDTADYLRS